MASDQLKDLHLLTMQSFLPIGFGIFKNAQAGGLTKVIEVFRSKDPFSDLQIDGETSARNLRNKIDQLVPGLGNPVVSVNVSVEENSSSSETGDQDSLVSTLKRIDCQLTKLSQLLKNDISKVDN